MTGVPRRRQLAVLANAPSPYHAYFLRRLANELSGVRVHALFTHRTTVQPWTVSSGDAIVERFFADGDESIGDPVRGRVLADWRKGGRILDHLEASRIEVVICQGYNRPELLRILFGCRRRNIRVFLRADSNARDEHASATWKRVLKRALLRPLLRRLDGVMAVGTLGVEYYRHYGVPPERLHVAPYEPDYDWIREISPEGVRAFRARAGLSEGRRRFLYCGRLAEVKRVDLLLEAFTTIAGRRPDWDVVIAGDGPLRATLEAMVPGGLAGRVSWLGFLDVEDVRAAYNSADVLVLPSDREPWALVVNEAMAAGLVPVVSDVVGAGADLVEAGVNGAVFRRGIASDLARALLDVSDVDRFPALRDAVGPKLEAWRSENDPVDGVRAAVGWTDDRPQAARGRRAPHA